jgi:alpha 1,2-mannosyltransferase
MRLDDDSKILSCLEYDPFEFLRENGHEYGYRFATFDNRVVAGGLAELSKQYFQANEMEPPHDLLAHFKHGKMSTLTWDLMGHYSNFLITKVSFWRSPQVQRWLRIVDSSGIQYTNRVGDLLVQSITLLMFMPSSKIHRFTDWAYSHFTLTKSGHCLWGGLVTIRSQPRAEANVMLDWARNIKSLYASETEAGEYMFFCERMVMPMTEYPGF